MLSKLKKNLGKGCTFLSFSTDKARNESGEWENVNTIKAIMLNDYGKKDIVNIALEKNPVDLTEEDYQKIFYILNARYYDGEIKIE